MGEAYVIDRPRICLVTTLRASLNDTLMFVNYHRHIGVDDIILFFDDPRDEAIDILSCTENTTAIPCTSEHWSRLGVSSDASIEERQILNATFAIDLARAKHCHWIVHLDSDELIFS